MARVRGVIAASKRSSFGIKPASTSTRQDHLSGAACFQPKGHLANRQTEIEVAAELALDGFQQRKLPLLLFRAMRAEPGAPIHHALGQSWQLGEPAHGCPEL